MSPSDQRDVIVIGGGVIGLAIGWQAVRRGLLVTVLDPAPGTGASHVAAGMLAPVTEVGYAERALLRLTMAAAQRYPSFVAELAEATGMDPGYRTCGTLAVAMDAGDVAALDELFGFQQELGLPVERLAGRDCRELEPMLAPGVAGGLLVPGDHQIDNRRLVAALLAALTASPGARLVRQPAAGLLVDGNRAAGVVLPDGSELRAGTVVLAAGHASAGLPGLPEPVRPPIRPVKGQILRLRLPGIYRQALSRTLRGLSRGNSVYLVPRADGELVVGATVEELADHEVTAGGVYQLLRAAHEVFPLVAELELVESIAGVRPGTPDNAPLLGPTELPGLVLATGHYRNGILLAPITADLVTDLLATGTLPDLAKPFQLDRFVPKRVVELSRIG
ncbi:MAG: glycine oxidase ThiO [Sporichthyaceae bacterium]|nr:glycine oxidase ThiO [Sporichthyaceae bacterium]